MLSNSTRGRSAGAPQPGLQPSTMQRGMVFIRTDKTSSSCGKEMLQWLDACRTAFRYLADNAGILWAYLAKVWETCRKLLPLLHALLHQTYAATETLHRAHVFGQTGLLSRIIPQRFQTQYGGLHNFNGALGRIAQASRFTNLD